MGYTVTVESFRLLALRSEHGYTDRPDRALPLEPEAVSAAYQRYLSRAARQAEVERARTLWTETEARVRADLADAISQLHPAAGVLSEDLRAVHRDLDRLRRHIEAGLADTRRQSYTP